MFTALLKRLSGFLSYEVDDEEVWQYKLIRKVESEDSNSYFVAKIPYDTKGNIKVLGEGVPPEIEQVSSIKGSKQELIEELLLMLEALTEPALNYDQLTTPR